MRTSTDGSVDARSFYESRIDQLEQSVRNYHRRARFCSRLRLAIFVGGVTLLFVLQALLPWLPLMYGVAGVSVAAFVLAAGEQEKAEDERKRLARLVTWYRRNLARLDRRWSDLPEAACEAPERAAQLSRDLDLFGHGSLFQWVDRTTTPMGRTTLTQWLAFPVDPTRIERHQEIVTALAGERALREELYSRGAELAGSLADPKSFVAWATAPGWYAAHRLLALIIPALSVATVTVALLAAVLQTPSLLWCLGGLVVANVLVCIGWGGSIYDTFNQVSSRQREVDRYRSLFSLMVESAFRIPGLAVLRDRVGNRSDDDATRGSPDFLVALKRLDLIMVLASFRHAGLLAIGHVAIQPILLWDFHVCRLLDVWKRRFGDQVPEWFDMLGEYEALASLAAIRHDHPSWCFPRIDAKASRVTAEQLGHPLIADDARIENDVEVGPPGSVLLVTGSNMSGKSTLLRAIGVNVVLAQAGAPVCARQMTLPPVMLATSMRIRDSLEDGVSFYLAELKRLKDIVDLAGDAGRREGRTLLYLLDEILQGTNSRERHIAVAQVVAHLVAQGAIGAITTHDLELAAAPMLEGAVRPVHFRESFLEENGHRRMEFDYRLREGVASTTNALALLEMVGLGSSRPHN